MRYFKHAYTACCPSCCASEADHLFLLCQQSKDKAGLKQRGGCAGLAKALHSDTAEGLNPDGHASISDRHAEFGANRFRELPQKSFWSMVFEALQDPTLLLLMAAALVSGDLPYILLFIAINMMSCFLPVIVWNSQDTAIRTGRYLMSFSTSHLVFSQSVPKRHMICHAMSPACYAQSQLSCRCPLCWVWQLRRRESRKLGQRGLQSGLL